MWISWGYSEVQLLTSFSVMNFVHFYIVISGCPQIVPGASAGVIYSPNFPWNYPNSISCNWTITAYSWRKIKLSFKKFNLGWSSYYCSDYVEVKGRYGYQIGKYCGSQIPSPVILSESMHVQFHSDYWTSYSGFLAFYQTGVSFPTPNPTTYWPPHTFVYPTTYPATYSPPKASLYACNIDYQTSKSNFAHVSILLSTQNYGSESL